jgi:hypothetical protein
MLEVTSLLERIVKILDRVEIPYMLSGSLAMSAYTVSRHTRDIDFVVMISIEKVEVFLENFKEGYYAHESSIREEIKRKGMFNIIDFESGYKIDFVVLKTTPYRKLEFGRRILSNDLGFPVWIVSIEDLILSKLIWIQSYQSDIQMRDIEHLLINPTIDLNYIHSWIRELNLKTFELL